MRYRISGISLSAREYADESGRRDKIEKKLAKKIESILRRERLWKGNMPEISEIRILKESVDARKKPDVRAVFSLAFESSESLPLEKYEEKLWDPADLPEFPAGQRPPVVAGFGPCGIFAALVLALKGARPIVLERGKPMEERISDVDDFWEKGKLDPESNVQFGEGGAGTFSDGKLTTGLKDPRIAWILARFVEAGADPAINYRNKPHIGTDRLREMIPRIRESIIALGGEIRFSTKLDGISHEDGLLKAVITSSGTIETDSLILATGHSAEDTFRMLRAEGLEMRLKPFSIGVRIEHPQEDIDRAQYGDPDLSKIFGPAEYKLSHRCENGRGVYTFCMCPGGYVINAATEEGHVLTNGMSHQARDGKYANSGLLVDVRTEDLGDGSDPLAGIAFQKRYEKRAWEMGRNYRRDVNTDAREDIAAGVKDYCEDDKKYGAESLPVSSYGSFKGNAEDPVRACLPDFASDSMIEAMPHLGRKLKGFDSDEARLKAVESRSSSPIKITRDAEMNSSIRGLIPAGEGPGYAGGIMSAALDGIRAAEAVLARGKE